MRRELLVCLFLVLATLTVYWQVGNYEFVNLDDDKYIIENSQVQKGLSRESVAWAFTTDHMANWHPVTWLSHMLDFQLYGLNPRGHHLTNVFFHLVNTLLLFLVLQRMTGALWRSGFVAALFALHPLHVESVAWVAERKDVLSTLFWMLTLWAYIGYVKRPGVKRYLLIIVPFALGLMAKPMLVTLPFVLLLLDYWPLERIQLGQAGIGHPAASQPSIIAKKPRAQALSLLLEKIPLFLLAVGSSVVTFMVQTGGGAVGALEVYPFKLRIANALLAYVRYIIKMIWPQNLAVFYPHPGQSLPMWQAAAAGLLLLLISAVVIRVGRRQPYLPVGWLWYVGTLVPVIGLVQVGAQAMADRYTYVPLIGLFIMVAWAVPELLARWRHSKPALVLAATSLVVALMVCTSLQVKHWKNSLTLFGHALRVTTNNSQIHNNLANVLTQKGMLQKAIAHYSKALEINPNYADAHINLGVALANQGRLADAIKHYSAALRLKPKSPELHNNLGVALYSKGNVHAAIENYLTAVELRPDYAEAHNNLGNGLAQQGRLTEATVHYAKALTIRPDYPEAHNNLGVALARQGKFHQAINHFRQALRLKDDYAQARANLERALEEVSKANHATKAGETLDSKKVLFR
jgi:tetratricopeptide (TPR) repeat protein